MDSPYSPPKSELLATPGDERRVSHALVALCSGITIIPTVILVAAHLLVPEARDIGNALFWGGVLTGSLLAGALTLPFKRMPVWLAALIGPTVVLLTILGLAIWALATGRA